MLAKDQPYYMHIYLPDSERSGEGGVGEFDMCRITAMRKMKYVFNF